MTYQGETAIVTYKSCLLLQPDVKQYINTNITPEERQKKKDEVKLRGEKEMEEFVAKNRKRNQQLEKMMEQESRKRKVPILIPPRSPPSPVKEKKKKRKTFV